MQGRLKLVVVLAIAALPLAMLVGLDTAQGAPTLSYVEKLGKAIFLDENLSLKANQSCASCHAPEAGWVGPTSGVNAAGAVYEGSIPGAFGDRKPPSAAYATQAPVLHMPEEGFFVGGNFWDGRATGETLGSPAAEQALGPFVNPKEQALPSAADVVSRVCAATYGGMFRKVWGTESCTGNVSSDFDHVGISVAAYEASAEVNAFTSKFDAKKAGLVKFTKEENRGWSLFKGKGQCDLCHLANGPQPLFTDYTYDNLGIPKNPLNPMYASSPDWVDPGLGGFLASRSDYASYAEENLGKFKVPTLRNVGLGLPDVDLGLPGIVKAYGHNGYFKSLESIVHFYNTRDVLPSCSAVDAPSEGVNCWPAPEIDKNVNDEELGNLRLSPEDEAAIVAFLKTLSDGYEVVP